MSCDSLHTETCSSACMPSSFIKGDDFDLIDRKEAKFSTVFYANILMHHLHQTDMHKHTEDQLASQEVNVEQTVGFFLLP